MDYLDSVEKESINKKYQRVRSWYLYEQYKSLEKNQLDAARLLKSKSHQNNFLRQELEERRARRRLCGQHGLCQSESRLVRETRSGLSLSTNDLYETLRELHEENDVDGLKDSYSADGSKTSKYYDHFKKEDFSDSESIESVVDTVALGINLSQDVKQELEIVKKNIAQNINMQLEAVKENRECLEKFTKLNDEDVLSEDDHTEYIKDIDKKANLKSINIIESLLSVWSKLVVFAYNASLLNHGNCYSHVSSQLLTAVLVCDFLRRGVNRMCHILQSYVTPIEYASSDSDTSDATRDTRTFGSKSKEKYYNETRKSSCKFCSYDKPWYKPKCLSRKYNSEYKYHSKFSSNSRMNERNCRGASEPWRGYGNFTDETKTSGNFCNKCPNKIKNKFTDKKVCNCRHLKNIVNPILQVARYIESVIQDDEDTSAFL